MVCTTSPNPNLPYTLSDTTILHHRESIGDSINIYYHSTLDSFYIYIADDTIKVKPKGLADFMKKTKFTKTLVNHGAFILPSDSLLLHFNYPLGEIGFKNILVYDTIGVLEDVRYDISQDRKVLMVKYPWVAGEKYVLEVDSGVVKSMYGHELDSTGHVFTILTKDKTANLNIKVTNLDTLQSYVMRIIKEKVLITEVAVENTSEYELVLKGLMPDKYNVEIIEDANKNGQWDPGDYDKKRQPEKYVLSKGEKLRENRDAEMLINFQDSLKPKIEPKAGAQGLQNTTNQLQIRK
jgi:hypothetical protein